MLPFSCKIRSDRICKASLFLFQNYHLSVGTLSFIHQNAFYGICFADTANAHKRYAMNKLIILFCIVFFAACSNEASTPAGDRKDTARTTASFGSTTLSRESELQILDECIDNAKDNAGNDLDDAKAYALCRCVLLQMQQKYPGADSTALVEHLRDTTHVVQMAQQCQ
jgi:hypothetical protein